MSAWKEWQLAVKNGNEERAEEAWSDYVSECRRAEIHDRITYCDVNECEDCPRMGDDCDGDFDDERD